MTYFVYYAIVLVRFVVTMPLMEVTEMIDLKNRAWAEISLDNIEYNYREIRQRVPKESKICCVVKADAYGHGAPRVAKRLERAGADFFAVSSVDEALQLRHANISTPILILGYTPPTRIKELADNNISQCVYSYEYAELLTLAATESNVKISVHIKIDSGMGRLGFVFRHDEESLDELIDVCSRKCFDLEGIFTHFPTADGGDSCKTATQMHFKHFKRVIEALEKKGISFKIKHCANSATALDYPEYSLDMVRIGISLYGVLPSNDMNTDVCLKPTMTLRTVISNVKSVKKGDTIGYGAEYVAKKDMNIATLPIGYADGFRRINYTSQTKIYVNGTACDIVGRVCMDQIMIDVDPLDEVHVGDVVVIFGEGAKTSLWEFSKNNFTIPYEILCSVSSRVPRFYLGNNDD